MKIKMCVILFLISGFITNSVWAGVKLKTVESQGKTEFLAIGNPGFLKISGKGKGPSSDLAVENGVLNGKFEIDLSSLDTGMSLRNTHMKEKYLDVVKYPKATLTIKDQKIPLDWSLEKAEVNSQKIMGLLEIHGQTKPVEVGYTINKKAKIEAQFEIKISDFSIDIPSFMGVTVADKVTVKVQSELKNAN